MEQKKILVVDDEERNVKLLRSMLETESYLITDVFNGTDALQKVKEFTPDLILLDIMMPGINGFEVCKILKQQPETKMIPIVMVTAMQEEENRLRGFIAGADDFLTKPINKSELLCRVRSLLRIKSFHDLLLNNLEEISQKNQKLERMEKLKNELNHMVVHDLKNPLMGISASLELVLMEKENISRDHLDLLEKCLSYCSDLNQLIQSILDIDNMEEDTICLNKQITNLNELTDEVLQQFRPRTRLKGVTFSFKNLNFLPSLVVDRELIKRVIGNLLNNALRHTPSGRSIQIISNFVSERKEFMFSVRDQGEGLSPEYHEAIFRKDDFIDLKKQGFTAGKSSIGLVFCKMAIEAHGGRIWVESNAKGNGCTFSFTLPV